MQTESTSVPLKYGNQAQAVLDSHPLVPPIEFKLETNFKHTNCSWPGKLEDSQL